MSETNHKTGVIGKRVGMRRAGWTAGVLSSGGLGLAAATKLVAAGAAVTMGASLLTAPDPTGQPDWTGDVDLPELQEETSVEGEPVAVAESMSDDQTRDNAITSLPEPQWPGAGTAMVQLPAQAQERAAGAGKAQADGLPVRVGRGAQPRAADGAGPERLRVRMLDRDEASELGVTGVAFSVADADGNNGGSVEVELDYSDFATAYGAGWSSRLRLLELPECALTDPDEQECRTASPVPGENDPSSQTVSAQVALAEPEDDGDTESTPDRAGRDEQDGAGDSGSGDENGREDTDPDADDGSEVRGGGSAPQGDGDEDEDSPTVLAAVAGAKGPEGDFTATDLSPAGEWAAGNQSGSFEYSYPFQTPDVPGGLKPNLQLSYDSGSVDGRTSATNNQASWVGDGWGFTPGGFIERQYKPCAEDEGGNEPDDSGDLCWFSDNATIQVGGVTGELIKDSDTGEWVASADSGAEIERLTGADNGARNGEYWKVTTTDGTQYFLGRNRLPGWSSGDPETNSTFTAPVFGNHSGEPCHASDFEDSWCDQAWRWNLDLVIDPHGNAMSFYYEQETNRYTLADVEGDATEYVRGGYPTRVEYGLREGNLYGTPSAKVEFDVDERCLPSDGVECTESERTEDNADHWPDTPVDLICEEGDDCQAEMIEETGGWDPGSHSPAFFTTKRLTGVTTKLHHGGWKTVDSWELDHLFPGTTDGTDPALWLESVQRTGHTAGTETAPEAVFEGIPMDNRVDDVDDRPLPRYRLTGVDNGHGGFVGVSYAEAECDTDTDFPEPHENTLLCFPTWWKPYSGYDEPILDWFHKYVVDEVVEQDKVGGNPAVHHRYEYDGGGAWAWDTNELVDEDERTWSVWRGFETVRTIQGDSEAEQIVSESTFLRGMDDDRLPSGTRDVTVSGEGGSVRDHEAYAGMLREERVIEDGELVGLTVHDPWRHGPTAEGERGDGSTARAWRTDSESVRGKARMSDGSWRYNQSNTEFDGDALPVATEDLGEVDEWGDRSTTGDETCTRTSYVHNRDANIIGAVSETVTHEGTCDSQADPDTVLGSERLSYDGRDNGQAPTTGDITHAEVLHDWTADGKEWSTTSAEYDDYGRMNTGVDALGGETTTEYSPEHGPVTEVTVTDPKGHTASSEMDPLRGKPVSMTDPAGVTTSAELDALGRVTQVWDPKRTDGDQPSSRFSYTYRDDAPTYVESETLQDDGSYRTSYELLDGLLRPRQTQQPAPTGGRILEDTVHDSRGLKVKKNGPYWNEEDVEPELLGVSDNAVPAQTVHEYDDRGRETDKIFRSFAEERWRVETIYHGEEMTSTVPPEGGTATAVLTNALGQSVEKRDYTSAEAARSGSHDPDDFQSTEYSYTPAGELESVTGPGGATWSFEYDLVGNRVRTVDPDAGESHAEYNEAGLKVSTTDARGESLAYRYDEIGRETAVHEGSLDGPTLIEHTFDSLGDGRPVSSTRYVDGDPFTVEVTGYDDAGRQTGTTYSIPDTAGVLGGEYEFETTYTDTGKVATERVPEAGNLAEEVIHRTYDEDGLPESSYAWNPATGMRSTFVSDTSYTVFGEVHQIRRGSEQSSNNVYTTNFYEEDTRRLSRTIVDRQTSTDSRVVDRRYSYEDAGNIERIADEPLGRADDVQCFDHDWLGRLNQAWTPEDGECDADPAAENLGGAAPYWLEWEFDESGNRTVETEHDPAGSGETVREYEHPEVDPDTGLGRPHTVDEVHETAPNGTESVSHFGYDEAGNTVSREIDGDEQTLEWDAFGRVEKVVEANGEATEYIYDADGTRLLVDDPEATTLYLPGMELRVEEGNSWIDGIRYYEHGGMVAIQRDPSGASWLHGDHQGTGVLTMDVRTLEVTQRHHTPFGTPRGNEPDWPNRKGFLGGDQDTTGLTHIGARHYDPEIGRFLSADPIIDYDDTRQMHGYAYSNQSPVNYSDPDGLHAEWGPDGLIGDSSEENASTREHQIEVQQSAERNRRARSRTARTSNIIPVGASWSDPVVDGGFGFSETHTLMGQGHAVDPQFTWADYVNITDFDKLQTICNFIEGDTGGSRPAACGPRPQRVSGGVVVAGILTGLSELSGVADAGRCSEGNVESCLALTPFGRAWNTLRLTARSGRALHTSGRRSCASFVPGTQVRMADGELNDIAEIEIGDEVLAKDPETDEASGREVVATLVDDGDQNLVEITTEIQDKQNPSQHVITQPLAPHSDAGTDQVWDGSVIATTDHGFWESEREEWIDAGDLQPGAVLSGGNGEKREVQQVREWSAETRVHNLTVSGVHTYYVGIDSGEALVQNSIPEGCGLTSSPNSPELPSKTVYLGRRGENFRVDVENPSPGKPNSAGIHVQYTGRGAKSGDKYYYNPTSDQWFQKGTGKMLSPREAARIPSSAIDKAYKYLGIGQ
ncbi:RHS repeat-associated core domain-containing protein [Haloechinothrix sp. LS1_15]|uniref:RHS repeat-associated core domain-containing protein n=1 Tax=Haloechinothrix sp. LS1_15 TaxID=2652248 RepID=UPI002947E9B9|nr:RHS repeat-associated core domain-containing protein [Haloechinothrix sp. LS1_15]MDV6014403.1 type IV secretion protein Rhs [Haloechinothrix sp. LS1_15]